MFPSAELRIDDAEGGLQVAYAVLLDSLTPITVLPERFLGGVFLEFLKEIYPGPLVSIPFGGTGSV